MSRAKEGHQPRIHIMEAPAGNEYKINQRHVRPLFQHWETIQKEPITAEDLQSNEPWPDSNRTVTGSGRVIHKPTHCRII